MSSPWIWKGVSATLQSGRYTLSYLRWRRRLNCAKYQLQIHWMVSWIHNKTVSGPEFSLDNSALTTNLHLWISTSLAPWAGSMLVRSSIEMKFASLVLRMTLLEQSVFFKRSVTLWNALPRQLRDADPIYCVKRKLVMHYDNLFADFDTDNVCTWSGAFYDDGFWVCIGILYCLFPANLPYCIICLWTLMYSYVHVLCMVRKRIGDMVCFIFLTFS